MFFNLINYQEDKLLVQVFSEVDYSKSGEIMVENIKRTYSDYCGKMLNSDSSFQDILAQLPSEDRAKALLSYEKFAKARSQLNEIQRVERVKRDFEVYDQMRFADQIEIRDPNHLGLSQIQGGLAESVVLIGA